MKRKASKRKNDEMVTMVLGVTADDFETLPLVYIIELYNGGHMILPVAKTDTKDQ